MSKFDKMFSHDSRIEEHDREKSIERTIKALSNENNAFSNKRSNCRTIKGRKLKGAERALRKKRRREAQILKHNMN